MRRNVNGDTVSYVDYHIPSRFVQIAKRTLWFRIITKLHGSFSNLDKLLEAVLAITLVTLIIS